MSPRPGMASPSETEPGSTTRHLSAPGAEHEPLEEGRPPGGGAPVRCLVALPPSIADALAMRGLLASLAASGRELVALARGAQAAVLDPTLLQLRMRHAPGRLELPISAPLESVDAQRLRRLGCVEAILLEPSWWAIRATAAGVVRRVGPAGVFGVFLTTRLSRRRPGQHAADLAERWAAELGIEWRELPALHVSDTWRRFGRERLVKARIDVDEPKVGLYLGSAGGRGGIWPGERIEELARELRRRRPRTQIIILSGEAELWQSVLLYERTGKIHPVIGPDLEADGLAAVLHHLDLVVAADSTVLHTAAALGTATLGLYERRALRRAPRGVRSFHLEHQPLKKLGVEEVANRCEKILEGASP